MFDPIKGMFDPIKGIFDPIKDIFDPIKGIFDPIKAYLVVSSPQLHIMQSSPKQRNI